MELKEKSRILLVEDEEDIRDIMTLQLETDGHIVITASHGQAAIEEIQNSHFDLFIIDRMLPFISGIDVLKFIRHFKRTRQTPVLIVTALSRTEDIVTGLEAGADDYITKPYEMKVLLARVKALLRRNLETSTPQQEEEIQDQKVTGLRTIGKLTIDQNLCRVKRGKEVLPLTPSEFRILSHLSENTHKVLTRRQLVNLVQGGDVFVTERTIDTHISSLRKKLGSESEFVETIRGVGYRVKETLNEKIL